MWTDIKRIDDPAQNVAKFVFTNKSAVAEAVLYRYPTYRERTVICCSTQSGCPVGCRFCGAGDKFVRSLKSNEIVDQVKHLIDQTETDPNEMGRLQIMSMAMGEPLLNLKEFVPALRELHRLYPKAALLISTSAPDIDYSQVRDISIEISTIGLQFSIHESTDGARNRLIPFKNKLNLAQIASEGYLWFQATGRKPFFNYCANDSNSTEEDANRIRDLLNPDIWEATISVVCERDDVAATNQHQRDLATEFSNLLLERGFNVRVFDPAGQDTISGGCGQLWETQRWMDEHPSLTRPSIGFGKPKVHTPS